MEKIEKLKALSRKAADAAADIGLINQYSKKELTPEEVYCFSLILCDNEVDRDNERFTDAALEGLAPLFLGKPGLFDHRWSAEKLTARLYRCEVESAGEQNSLGEERKVLRGDAYMLRNASSKKTIDAIEGGIIKEVSVGCAVAKTRCSVCGADMSWGGCKEGHQKGVEYDGKLCFGELDDPRDAYEFSFVAVPVQHGAGVTKGYDDPDGLIESVMAADITKCAPDKLKALVQKGQDALLAADERQQRAEIIAENAKYIREKE